MKRSICTLLMTLILALTLLFSACAPAPYMVATLTQLPFAGTPATKTPYPTFTPYPTLTPSPISTVIEAAGTIAVTTPTGESTLDTTVAVTLTPAAVPDETITPSADCPPFTFDTSLPGPDTPDQYIGRHYDLTNPPTDLDSSTAGLLENDSLSWAHVNVRGRDMYWVQKMVCRDSQGKAYWVIIDALTLPLLNANAHEVATDLCFRGEQQIPFAIAYGTYDSSKPAKPVINNFVGWPIQVKKAWELTDKFTPLEAQGLTCMLQEPQITH